MDTAIEYKARDDRPLLFVHFGVHTICSGHGLGAKRSRGTLIFSKLVILVPGGVEPHEVALGGFYRCCDAADSAIPA